MSGKRAIQKRSKAESPKRRRGLDFALGEGSGLALVVSGAASFAGALAGTAGLSPTRRYLDRMFRLSPGDGPETAAAAAGTSGAGEGGVATAAAGVAAAGTVRFDVACLRPGATRDFLRARYRGPKPQYAIAEHTGIPADTIRKALQQNNPSEISGPHLMRLVSVFGPPFLAAVLDPVPVWVRAWCETEGGP